MFVEFVCYSIQYFQLHISSIIISASCNFSSFRIPTFLQKLTFHFASELKYQFNLKMICTLHHFFEHYYTNSLATVKHNY